MIPLWRSVAAVMAALAGIMVITAAGCLHDLSGLTMNSEGRILAVNNRPGLFAWCEPDSGRLDCKKLTFRLPTYSHYDLEGVTWVGNNRFFAVAEKRDNQCLAGCELSQEVMAFTLDDKGEVVAGPCGPLIIPLYADDNPDCPFANCGLEGVAFDPDRKLLYVAKEADQPRLFAVQLDGRLCPDGAFKQLALPRPFPGLSDLAYSSKRQSLFILSSRGHGFYGWHLPSKEIRIDSSRYPECEPFFQAHIPVEGIYVDDSTDTLLLLAEDGALLTLSLPPVEETSADDERASARP